MKKFKFSKPLIESPYPPQDTNVLWVDIKESTGKISTIKKFFKGQWIDYLQFVPEPLEFEPFVGPANNEIWYTTIDGQPFDFQNLIDQVTQDASVSYSGPQVISNVFDSSKNVYIMTFDSTITKFGMTLINDGLLFDAPMFANPNVESSIIFQNIWLPSSVTTLGYFAYYKTASEEIKIPKNVTTFGYMPIVNNPNLKKLILPNTITKLPIGTVYYNSELQIIEFQGTVAQWNNIEKERQVSDDGEVSTWILECPLAFEVQCIDGNVPIL